MSDPTRPSKLIDSWISHTVASAVKGEVRILGTSDFTCKKSQITHSRFNFCDVESALIMKSMHWNNKSSLIMNFVML